MVTNFLYKEIEENKELPDAYIEKAKLIAERQLVIGGLRLANLLKSLNLQDKEVQTKFLW